MYQTAELFHLFSVNSTFKCTRYLEIADQTMNSVLPFILSTFLLIFPITPQINTLNLYQTFTQFNKFKNKQE